MGKETIKQKIKNIIYKITLPIYLWSIGCKTLEEYITRIEEEMVLDNTTANLKDEKVAEDSRDLQDNPKDI